MIFDRMHPWLGHKLQTRFQVFVVQFAALFRADDCDVFYFNDIFEKSIWPVVNSASAGVANKSNAIVNRRAIIPSVKRAGASRRPIAF